MSEDGINCQKIIMFVEEPAGFLSTIQIGITLAGFFRQRLCRRKLLPISGRLDL